jgi:hypothetical protein
VLIPLFYVVAKNMEVDLQNKDLKEEILALCQKLGKSSSPREREVHKQSADLW